MSLARVWNCETRLSACGYVSAIFFQQIIVQIDWTDRHSDTHLFKFTRFSLHLGRHISSQAYPSIMNNYLTSPSWVLPGCTLPHQRVVYIHFVDIGSVVKHTSVLWTPMVQGKRPLEALTPHRVRPSPSLQTTLYTWIFHLCQCLCRTHLNTRSVTRQLLLLDFVK